VSFLPGGRARKPRIQRTVVTRQTTRVDTLRVTDTVHVHDTVTVSQVRTQVKVDTSVILVLQDVNFGFGKSALRPAAQPVLNRLAVQLNAPVSFFFVQDGKVNGGYQGPLTNPLMFVPSAP